MPERFLAFLRHQRRTFEMTWEERYDARTSMPVWWPIPTENTLDRATTQLPRLMYDRMDELGLDFSIVYPGIGLQIVTLPGLAILATVVAINLFGDGLRDALDPRLKRG